MESTSRAPVLERRWDGENMTFMPRSLWQAAVFLLCACAGCLLLSKLLFGLDFTDEMQYYGEIVSLLVTGKLFQNDLFIQQFPYAFLYPIYWVFHRLSGDFAYLVLFSRVLLLVLIAGTSFAFYRAVRHRGSDQIALGLAVLWSWFGCQPFAPSYNTAAYLLCVVILSLWLANTDHSRPPALARTAILLVMLGVVYPPAGAVLGVFLIGDLLARRSSEALKLGAACLAAAVVVVAGLFQSGLVSADDLALSLDFSSSLEAGFAIVARDRWHSGHLALFVALSLAVIVLLRRSGARQIDTRPWLDRLLYVVLGVTAVGLALAQHHFLPLVSYLTILYTAAARRKPLDHNLLPVVMRLGTLGLALGVCFSLTSSNGAIKFAFGPSVVLPFLVALAAPAEVGDGLGHCMPGARAATYVAIAALLLSDLLHPYREAKLWELGATLENVPAYRGIRTTPVKRESAIEARRMLADGGVKANRRVMIVGAHPWLYFVSQSVPETPMVFMHDGVTDGTRAILARELGKYSPDHVVIAQTPGRVVRGALISLLTTKDYACGLHRFDPTLSQALQREILYPVDLWVQICSRAVPAHAER